MLTADHSGERMRKIITVERMSATMITSLMHVQSYPITTCTPGQEKNQERREEDGEQEADVRELHNNAGRQDKAAGRADGRGARPMAEEHERAPERDDERLLHTAPGRIQAAGNGNEKLRKEKETDMEEWREIKTKAGYEREIEELRREIDCCSELARDRERLLRENRRLRTETEEKTRRALAAMRKRIDELTAANVALQKENDYLNRVVDAAATLGEPFLKAAYEAVGTR
nr:MAG TPA: Glial fibrillary acidic protein fibrillary acidic protein [Caudoviricetes sp.]